MSTEANITYHPQNNKDRRPFWDISRYLVRLRNHHFFFMDVLLLLLTPSIALALRVNLPPDEKYLLGLVLYTIGVLIPKLVVFFRLRLYHSYWRYASIDEMLSIVRAGIMATGLSLLVFFLIHNSGLPTTSSLPRSLPLIDSLLTLLVVGGTRFSTRAAEVHRTQQNKGGGKRVLVIGAGDAGEKLVREMRNSDQIKLEAVGFLDDDKRKHRTTIHGVKILGSIDVLPQVVKEHHIQEVIIAMPTAPGKIIREVVKLCEEAEVPSRALPGIFELLNGRVSVNRIRNVEIGDLLRRAPVQADNAPVKDMLSGKRVLITGAGGSIGSELCTQILACQPAELIALGHGENSLFNLVNHLNIVKASLNGKGTAQITPVLADIRDRYRMQTVFNVYKPQIIFHAAAHKHVPMTEDNLDDAITTNILGTRILLEQSKASEVERFVMISTDKAVNPVNVLGMTKLVAELLVRQAYDNTGRPYVAVRFGNVLGSRGSVVPYFQQQIAMGGPVTVTHPDVTRFFMTIPEAVDLVLQAATLGRGREVFVLDMGEPVRIADLARDMIELSGYEVGRDIDIAYTELRPGEKMCEELFGVGEHPTRTVHDKIFVACEENTLPVQWLDKQVDELIQLAQSGELKEAHQLLSGIVRHSTPG